MVIFFVKLFHSDLSFKKLLNYKLDSFRESKYKKEVFFHAYSIDEKTHWLI